MRFITTPERVGIEKGFRRGLKAGKRYIATAKRLGIAKGIQQGESNLLLRLLVRRFHGIPPTYLARIQQASAETLLIWGERIFDASRLEEVFL